MSFIPRHVGRFFNHIVTIESRNGDKFDDISFVTNFFKERGNFLFDFVISRLRIIYGFFVHFVHANNDLFDSESEGKESVFFGLSFFGDTSFEFSLRRGNHEDSAIGL